MKPVALIEKFCSRSTGVINLGYKTAFMSAIRRLEIGTLDIQIPNGEKWQQQGNGYNKFSADIQIHDKRFYRSVMTKGGIGMAESYRDGWVDSSDMVTLLRLAQDNEDFVQQVLQGKWYGKLLYRMKHLSNRNSKSGSQKNIHAHYDLGNNFYQLWLDKSMTYSSALFLNKDDDLLTAQTQKYARIFKKANVSSGDTILEIGCGWGGFAEYAAKQGVKVVGVSLSKEQLKYAKNRLNTQGLSHLAEFRYQDYRDIPETNFSAVVSIEMIEAVGASYWDSYFECLYKKVKSGGSVVIQAITIAEEYFVDYKNSTDFIQQYIFPGGILPSPSVITKQLKKHKLELKNYKTFGEDYAKTLSLWQDEFERTLDVTKSLGFDEDFIKLWRFYYSYCQAGFLAKTIDVAHIQAVKN